MPQNSYSEAADNGLVLCTNWKSTRWKIMELFGSNLDRISKLDNKSRIFMQGKENDKTS